jgi:hypothetical protein
VQAGQVLAGVRDVRRVAGAPGGEGGRGEGGGVGGGQGQGQGQGQAGELVYIQRDVKSRDVEALLRGVAGSWCVVVLADGKEVRLTLLTLLTLLLRESVGASYFLVAVRCVLLYCYERPYPKEGAPPKKKLRKKIRFKKKIKIFLFF